MMILMNQIPVYQISNAVSLLLYRFFMANILFQRFKCIGNLYHVYTNLILQFKNIITEMFTTFLIFRHTLIKHFNVIGRGGGPLGFSKWIICICDICS